MMSQDLERRITDNPLFVPQQGNSQLQQQQAKQNITIHVMIRNKGVQVQWTFEGHHMCRPAVEWIYNISVLQLHKENGGNEQKE